jgi:hypothetical protein
MSVVRTLNSKIATRTVWALVAVLAAAMFLYANQSTIASYRTKAALSAATTAPQNPVVEDEVPGAPGTVGSATQVW